MGLCKCPKRKVTNLFCFEHRVNVCEHCLVSNHNKVGGCNYYRIVLSWSCLYNNIIYNVALYLHSSHIYRAQFHSQLVNFCVVIILHFIVIICAFLLVALQCIVQSYLQWLQDSDYNPNCSLCNDPLTAQDTVRLVCYGEIVNLICIDSSCKMSTANVMKHDFTHL